MKIAQVFIQDTGGFQGLQLDLTYPEGHEKAGQALEKVCFIGPNGSGKSRMMALLMDYLRNIIRFRSKSLFVARLQLDDRFIYSVHLMNNTLFFREDIDTEPQWMAELIRDQAFTMAFNTNYEKFCIGFEEDPELFDALWFDNNTDDVVVYLPADYYKDRLTQLTDVPHTKGHEAESLKTTFPLFNEISPENVTEFWALLIYLIVQREDARREFINSPENRHKPSSVMDQVFDRRMPPVLASLKAVWQPVLDPLGLELDVDSADLPRHIKDRLKLYLIRKSDGEKLEYNQLGSGLRRHLFNLGHTWALFHNREVKQAFSFLEQPEANLYPGLLRDLIGQYGELTQGGQMFVTTHNPLIAQAFDPAERYIFSFAENGELTLKRSEAPADAELATLLESDFS
ncbi:MAG: AAA family ATPase [Bacteroidota bacterium]